MDESELIEGEDVTGDETAEPVTTAEETPLSAKTGKGEKVEKPAVIGGLDTPVSIEPPDYDQCTVSLVITLLPPKDGQRMVILTAATREDPVPCAVRAATLAELGEDFSGAPALLAQLVAETKEVLLKEQASAKPTQRRTFTIDTATAEKRTPPAVKKADAAAAPQLSLF